MKCSVLYMLYEGSTVIVARSGRMQKVQGGESGPLEPSSAAEGEIKVD